jgi:Fanconi-associated nuclease 1
MLSGVQCRSVDWTSYELQQLKDIANCLGGHALAGIFKLFAEDYNSWGKGLPDLLLWKPGEGMAKLAEVKGPRDRYIIIRAFFLTYIF